MKTEEAWSLFQHLTNSLVKEDLGDPRLPTQWPSEASAIIAGPRGPKVLGACRRASFLRLAQTTAYFDKSYTAPTGLVRDPPADYMRYIWKAGELYEDWLIEQMKVSGVFIQSQPTMYIPECNLSGKADAVGINPLTGLYFLSEIKSGFSFNMDYTLGKPADNRRGIGGKPRDSNLMQLALYHWHKAAKDPRFEESRLLYGDRGTGRYGEYLVKTVDDAIFYRMIVPVEQSWIKSPITISSILECYKYIKDHVDRRIVPPRDFDLQYSREQVDDLYKAGELNRTNSIKYEKIKEKEEENKARAETKGKKLLKELKPLELGDYQCARCDYRRFCYDEHGQPRDEVQPLSTRE